MDKLWLIIQREYLTRVKKKSFLLSTLLAPLFFVGLFTVPVILVMTTGGEQKKIAVKDDAGIFSTPGDTTERANLVVVPEPLQDIKGNYREKGFDGVLHIPATVLQDTSGQQRVTYYSDSEMSLSTRGQVEGVVENLIEMSKFKAAGLDRKVLSSYKKQVIVDQRELTRNEKGDLVEVNKSNSAGIATGIGYISALTIYMILLIYGSMIMRSVMEEKTSRIVEVIISSVKPVQLMMGKIIGVSAVGLTQILVWFVLTTVLMSVATAFLPIEPQTMGSPMGSPMSASQMQDAHWAVELIGGLSQQDWGFILPFFVLYFIGGYFIYSSMFAAIGSAMGDDMGEGQSLTFVVMMPIILSIVLMTPVIENPNGNLAVWLSIIPLFSPVLMPARLAFDPPLWQVLLSAVVLIASALFFVWLSARIYRVGILMYGKKATLKEIGKWMLRG